MAKNVPRTVERRHSGAVFTVRPEASSTLMLEPAGFASTLLTIPLYPLKADATRGEAISIAPTDCWRLSRPKWLTQLFAQSLSSYHCEFFSVLL
jgi:hypothetical protein